MIRGDPAKLMYLLPFQIRTATSFGGVVSRRLKCTVAVDVAPLGSAIV
jgi:hypothetical protein